MLSLGDSTRLSQVLASALDKLSNADAGERLPITIQESLLTSAETGAFISRAVHPSCMMTAQVRIRLDLTPMVFI
jgi:hypothetical protein